MEVLHYGKVTVIGGGNGGFATAADLTIRGHQVTLFELPQFSSGLSEVIKRGGIDMEAYANNGLQGALPSFIKLPLIFPKPLQNLTLFRGGPRLLHEYHCLYVCSAPERRTNCCIDSRELWRFSLFSQCDETAGLHCAGHVS